MSSCTITKKRPQFQSLTITAFTSLTVVCLLDGATAATLDRRITIQPIQICNDVGTGCANSAQQLFAAETGKIWAEAGIDVNFLPFSQFNNTSFLNIDSDSEFFSLVSGPNHGQNPNNQVINLWFLDSLFPDPVYTTYGYSMQGGNGLLISNSVFSYNGGLGRLDTIAHELGHNLGLDHNTFGAGAANNLMSNGSVRAIPNSISNIFPDGSGLDQLNQAQIAQARSSQFLVPIALPTVSPGLDPTPAPVPEPAPALAMLGFGLMGLLLNQRRQCRLQASLTDKARPRRSGNPSVVGLMSGPGPVGR